MSIYTKTGDKGTTGVFDGKTKELIRVSKTSCQIRAIGAIDELNSFLGIVKTELSGNKVTAGQRKKPDDDVYYRNITVVQSAEKIEQIQGNLFTINSILAGGKIKFGKNEVKKMEEQIDEWEGSLPVQTNFIYYGGSQASALLFYARALCRRAERLLVSLSRSTPSTVHESPLIYLNRLSDYLFMLARVINFESKTKETSWISGG